MPYPAGGNYPGQVKFVLPIQPSRYIEDIGGIGTFDTDSMERWHPTITNGGDSVTGEVTDEIPFFPIANGAAGNNNQLPVIYEDTDELFSNTTLWRAPVDFVLRKITINALFFLQATLPDPIVGAPSLDTVFVNMTQFTGGSEKPLLTTSGQGLTYPTGLPTMNTAGAVNSQYYYLLASEPANHVINAGDYVAMKIEVDAEVEGATTFVQGLFMRYPLQPTIDTDTATSLQTMPCFILEGVMVQNQNVPLRTPTTGGGF